MHRYLHKEDKYIKIFECSIYPRHFAYTIITTLKCLSLQYIFICLVFLMYNFTAKYSVHFHPWIKNLTFWIHSTFFKMKYQKKLNHRSGHRKWSIMFWEDTWLINQKSVRHAFVHVQCGAKKYVILTPKKLWRL